MMSGSCSLRLLIAFLLLPLDASAAAPTAVIDSGPIIGTVTSLPSSTVSVHKFLGIPFAAPPTKQRRFAPPEAPQSWSQPRKTQKYGPSCVQQFNSLRNFTIAAFDTPGPPAGESEDCLYINVFAPAAPGTNRTVMFWIYGGSLQFGSNSVEFYDGTSFAAHQDVIVVVPNYRTNAFGFPQSPQLPLTKRNLGFLDQRLALRWVQRNIHAFGGSPDKVTIFGESAGAVSVDELITTTPVNPPFRAAILQSGEVAFSATRNNSNHPAWDALMSGLNCTGTDAEILACARAAPAHRIKSLEEHQALDFGPVSDNVTQLEFPVQARAAGKIARVPILIGTNMNEGRLFAMGLTNITAYLLDTLPNLPPSLYQAIIAAYPIVPGTELSNSFDVISQILTDFSFQCPAAIVANISATDARIPTWRYLFNASFPNTQVFPGAGVFHSSEIPLVYGTYPTANATAQEAALSVYMQTVWADFAKNPARGPGWAPWPNVGVLGTQTGKAIANETNVPADLLDQRCALYAPIYAAILSGSA